eukprot:COSAG02_NODE_940_length_15773_cov_5.301263_8_plen_1082_part_00
MMALSPTSLAVLLLLRVLRLHATCTGGGAPFGLDTSYAPDHANYLCTNWTRPTPLPCRDAADGWAPKWVDATTKKKKFVIFAWWPPLPADFAAYAEAGFNLALTGAMAAEYCSRNEHLHGPSWSVSHDEMFEAILDGADKLARLGVLSVFETENGCNSPLLAGPTVAYGNATGGVIIGSTNITSKTNRAPLKDLNLKSRGQTVPEMRWVTSEWARRNVSQQFAGVFLHDDTVTQTGRDIGLAAWLKTHHPDVVPLVNQQMGNSGPETLYRSELFVSSPEQYQIRCINGSCAGLNATAMAMAQQNSYMSNAAVDTRFDLHHWPLFNMGAGTSNDTSNRDLGRDNVRSDSLVRWQIYAAIAYGAKGLNYYCWGGGVWYYNFENTSLPGRPSPMYDTVKEINADAAKWGDIIVGDDYHFASALNTGWLEADSRPNEDTIVTKMDDALLVGSFVQHVDDRTHKRLDKSVSGGESGLGCLLVVDKRVSTELRGGPDTAPRNVTLVLHPAVESAVVVSPGVQGRQGFDRLHPDAPVPIRLPVGSERGAVQRSQYSSVVQDARTGVVSVTVSLTGGGAAFIMLTAAQPGSASSAAALRAASYAVNSWTYRTGAMSLNDNNGNLHDVGALSLKQPEWAYDTWHAQYRQYENLEITAGRSFEDGEQTSFIIAGSMTVPSRSSALSGPLEAKAWAWSGFNLLAMPAPDATDAAAYGPASRAIGDVLDWGYAYGFFSIAEPPHPESPVTAAGGDGLLSARDLTAINNNYRCHGRWAGFHLGREIDASNASRVAAAAHALKTVGRGGWLLAMVSTSSAAVALELANLSVPLPMPSVPFYTGGGSGGSAQHAAQAIAQEYSSMLAMLTKDWTSTTSRTGTTRWHNNAPIPFVASIDACATESDSLLRFAAFSSLAYGSRGIFWRGARHCAAVETPKFGLLASINRRIAQWGNTFVSETPTGYNITRLWSTGYDLPGASRRPGAGGSMDLVQEADDNVLVAELGSMGRYATPLVLVINKEVEHAPGAAPLRELSVKLHHTVAATQPLEGDCAASRCQCGMSNLGSTIRIKLPGGSGQLVALAMCNATDGFCRANV